MAEKLYTVTEAAKITGKAIVTVRMLVRTHGLGQKVGSVYVLTDQDIKALEKIPGPGRPKGSRKTKA